MVEAARDTLSNRRRTEIEADRPGLRLGGGPMPSSRVVVADRVHKRPPSPRLSTRRPPGQQTHRQGQEAGSF